MNKDRLYLTDILRCAERILAYTTEGKEAFEKSTLIQDAVIRNFEIVGEAVKQVSDETRTANADVPWRVIGRFRDVLIHHYMGVDLNEVWNIVEKDLPGLKVRIQEILRTLP